MPQRAACRDASALTAEQHSPCLGCTKRRKAHTPLVVGVWFSFVDHFSDLSKRCRYREWCSGVAPPDSSAPEPGEETRPRAPCTSRCRSGASTARAGATRAAPRDHRPGARAAAKHSTVRHRVLWLRGCPARTRRDTAARPRDKAQPPSRIDPSCPRTMANMSQPCGTQGAEQSAGSSAQPSACPWPAPPLQPQRPGPIRASVTDSRTKISQATSLAVIICNPGTESRKHNGTATLGSEQVNAETITQSTRTTSLPSPMREL